MAIAVPLGQHVTVGPAIVQPLVAAPVAPTKGFPIAPFAALCIITAALAIAATIVLALIPLYTKTAKVTPNCGSEAFPSTFNTNRGILPRGQLSSNNRVALESSLNQYVSDQTGFSRCKVEVRDSSVDDCPSTRRILYRRRRKQVSGGRRVRQVNKNCANQAIGMTSALNCGCTCVGACLRRKAQQLNVLFRSLSIPITFTDPTDVVVVITGPNLPTEPIIISTTSSSPSTTETPPTPTTTQTPSTPSTTSPMVTPMIG